METTTEAAPTLDELRQQLANLKTVYQGAVAALPNRGIMSPDAHRAHPVTHDELKGREELNRLLNQILALEGDIARAERASVGPAT